jgi:transposase InsO family protein
VSINTIHRHLTAAGLIIVQPHKRTKSSYTRCAAEQPNECWQADFTHWWLADGTHVDYFGLFFLVKSVSREG